MPVLKPTSLYKNRGGSLMTIAALMDNRFQRASPTWKAITSMAKRWNT